ncbi:Saccharopine dehydrogenase [Aspergillus nanangensis]|uniref:Saccharopine dehydrogenase n=1 Tax=Aspergillus nanangensis TaxID=2582783 RepID=A0AAD4CM29_ASPNN|nr:Saccharopine dehydrogenase [Aspergillus nanangensis]
MSSEPTGDTNASTAVPDASTNAAVADVNKEANGDSGLAKPTEESKTINDTNGIIGAGDKREHESTSASADNETPEHPSAKEEPAPKKQKTAVEKPKTQNGIAKEANGEKKKTARPKKTKDVAKRVIATDGIGSRTRSRTKASS